MAALIFYLSSDALAPYQCEQDPVGWDSLRCLIQRDTKRHGITFSVSTDLTFIKKAAAYLRLVYEGGADSLGQHVERGGPEALVALTVYEQDPNELRPVEIYRGQLDFTTYESAEGGVTARFKETGFATSLLSREDAAVDLFGNESLSGVALPTYAPVLATLHSQETLQRFEMRQVTAPLAPDTITISNSDGVSGEFGGSALVRVGFPEDVINEFGVQHGFGLYLGDVFSPLNVPLYTAKEAGGFTIDFSFVGRMTATFPRNLTAHRITISFYYRVDHKDGSSTTTRVYFSDQTISLGSSPSYVYAQPFFAYAQRFVEALNVGDSIFLYGECYIHEINSTYSIPITFAYDAGSYFRMRAVTTTAETTCAGLLVHEALQRVCEAATDQRGAFYSEYYGRTDTRAPYAQDGPGALRLLTNGFLLRGFPLFSDPAPTGTDPDTRKTISLSLSSLYDSLDATDCLGLGVEQRNGRSVVRVEPRAYFYQSAVSLELGAVTGLKKGVYSPWLYNEAQVGYAHWQSGAANGLDEFNGRRTYALPLTQRKQTYTAVSTLNASGYLIEEARRDRYSAGVTKEGQADAEGFAVCVRRNGLGYRSQTTQGFVAGSISGVLGPDTRYNLAISPGRMLPRHGPWLRSGLFAQPGKRLLLGKVEGNGHLVSQQTDEAAPLVEFRDVPVAELPAAIALAETYDFTVRLRRGQMRALQANPYGRISFLDSLGQRKSGYLLKAERTPQGGLTAFTLLRAA